MRIFQAVLAAFMLARLGSGQDSVSFETQDGARIFADVYGAGDRAVVLAHGARFEKGSWEPQARALAEAGFHVMAIDFRGYGKSQAKTQAADRNAGLALDILGAVRYLHQHGAHSVAVIGASMGGGAAAQAAVDAQPGEIDRLVLLAHVPISEPQRLKGRKLFAVSNGDSLAKDVREQYQKAPEPKELLVLEGSAHAQALFKTDQGDRLLKEIVRFLSDR